MPRFKESPILYQLELGLFPERVRYFTPVTPSTERTRQLELQFDFSVIEPAPKPDIPIDFAHIPETAKELARDLLKARLEGQVLGKGKLITPSEAEFLVREVFHNASDRMHFLEVSEPNAESVSSILGQIFHTLGEVIIRYYTSEHLQPQPLSDIDYVPSEQTYFANPESPSPALQAYFPELGDGINAHSFDRFYAHRQLSTPAINSRRKIASLLCDTLRGYKHEDPPSAQWLEARDLLHFQPELLYSKLEILLDYLGKVLGSKKLDRILSELSVTVSYEFGGPFIFNNLNPGYHGDMAQMQLFSEDVLVIGQGELAYQGDIEVCIQTETSIVQGTVSYLGANSYNISPELQPYCYGYEYSPESTEPYSITKSIEESRQILAIAVSAKPIDFNKVNLLEVFAAKSGHKLETKGEVRRADPGKVHYFRDYHLQEVRAFTRCRADLIAIEKDSNGNEYITITDYKSRYRPENDVAEELSVSIYMLNVATYIFERSYTKPIDDQIRIFGVSSADVDFWKRMRDHLRRVKFRYLDLQSGEMTDFDISPERAIELFRILKYLVELKIVYGNTLKKLISGEISPEA